MKKKPTPAQLAARAKFAEMARSGAFKKKKRVAKKNPAKKTVSDKISQLVHEGYPQKQAVAIAMSEMRAGKVKRNPSGHQYTVKQWKRGKNTASGNPVYEFVLIDASGYHIHGKTKPNANFVYGIGSTAVHAGDVITATLSKTASGRIYMTGFGSVDTYGGNPIVLVSDAPAKRRTKKNPITLISDKPKKNPVTRAYSKKKSNFPFVVEYKNKSTGNWNSKGAFKTNAEAKNYAYALHASHPSATIRVMKYTGGAM